MSSVVLHQNEIIFVSLEHLSQVQVLPQMLTDIFHVCELS